MKLAISLATRGRAAQLVDTISRSVVNWTAPDTEMWVMADQDDQLTVDATAAKTQEWKNVKLSVRPREDTIAEKWNRVIEAAPDADVYLCAADDDPYITPGYDAKILEAAERFPDGIGVVYGHMANASFTGAQSVTRKLVEHLGYFYPTYFPYWFVDHWIDDIARIIDRISFADIRTDQSGAGKTQEMREPAWWATFFDACYLQRRRDAHRVINAPEFSCLSWQRENLLRHHPLIEYRSKWINDNVRANARVLEGWSGQNLKDDRYLRVRNRAQDMVSDVLAELPPDEAARYNAALMPQRFIPALARLYG
jgi:hypothetical protein